MFFSSVEVFVPAPVDPHTNSDPAHEASACGGLDETIAGGSHDAKSGRVSGTAGKAGEVGSLGPYRVVKELGRGGMGAVYAAIDTRLNRKLALKVMLPQFAANPAAKERFLREARAAAQITHDNVVTVYEADEREGVPYIAMQFLEGCPLDEYLKKKGAPSLPQVMRIAREAAAGLAAAHKISLVHRDIKPANLWLEAPQGRVKVLDFGLAKPLDAEVELTKSGTIVGTPAYMSPEQARGEKIDFRSDLFSLGAVLYRLCSGRLPFEGPTTVSVLTALATQDPQPVRELNPAVSEPLSELIHAMLSKKPETRPASATEVAQRLRAIGEAAQSAAMSVSAAKLEENPFGQLNLTVAAKKSPPPRSTGKGRWVAAGIAALMAVVAGVIIIINNKDGTKTKIEVAEGATVTIQDQSGKPLAQFPAPVKGSDNSLPAWGGVKPPDATKPTLVDFFTSADYQWTEPQDLGVAVNVGKGNVRPVVSADGLELWFVVSSRGEPESQTRDLWFSRRKSFDAPWEAAKNAGEPINSAGREARLSLSADALNMVFQRFPPYKLFETSRTSKDASWSEPVPLNPLLSRDAMLSADGLELYFTANSRRLQRSTRPNRQTEWGTPVAVEGIEGAPWWLSLDGEWLLGSQREEGESDLWLAHRRAPDQPWDAPRKLELPASLKGIQTPFPLLMPAGLELYCSRNGNLHLARCVPKTSAGPKGSN